MEKFDIATPDGLDFLRTKVREHCEADVRVSQSRDMLLFGCGNADLVTRIVHEAISICNNLGRVMKERQGQTLQDYVAFATLTVLGDQFSWRTACDIIQAAENCVSSGLYLKIYQTAEFAVAKKYLTYGLSVDDTTKGVARSILWLEAYSFMVEHGYDWNEFPAQLPVATTESHLHG